jgi:putative NADH-flavin reductase
MARIHVLGGTGFAGAAVVDEAVRRGHQVTSFSRGRPSSPVEGVEYVLGSLLDDQAVQRAVTNADVVFETISPRGDMAGRLEGVVAELIVAADTARVRLGVLGGVSSVLISEQGPRLFDVTVAELPDEVLPEIRTGLALLDALHQAPETLDWFYVSPAQEFGSWYPQVVTGSYRVSDDVLLKDENGKSAISAADLAVAVLDEIEHPRYRRRRFHVAH